MSHTIGVDNSGVITSLLVKDHPEWMWYREAIQNALEATKTYISQKNIAVSYTHLTLPTILRV